jgi:O-antigen/teichoic acid export membrane protein
VRTGEQVVTAPEVGSAPVRSRLARAQGPVMGIGGQGLNAATNVVTAYLAAQLLAPDAFGEFVLAFAGVTLVLAAGRGLVGSTVLVHMPTLDETQRPALMRSAIGFTLLVGVAISLILLVVGPPELRIFTPWLTGALLQDAGRYLFLAEGKPGLALLLDVAWAVVQGAILGVWVLVGAPVGTAVLAGSWGCGALAGAVLLAVLADIRPGRPGPWVRATRDVAGWFTVVALMGAAEVFVVLLVTGTVLGPADAGGIRAAQLLAYQPALVVLGALLVLVTPVMVRARTSAAALRAATVRVLVAVSPVIVVLVAIAALRDPLMSVFFDRFTAYAPLVVPIALQGVLAALSIPAQALLRGLRRGRTVFAAQLVRMVMLFVGALVGVHLGGVTGVAWGLVVAMTLGLIEVQVVAQRAVRREVP